MTLFDVDLEGETDKRLTGDELIEFIQSENHEVIKAEKVTE